MNIIDTHSHLDDDRFKNIIDEIIDKSIHKGLKAIVNPSVTHIDFEKIVALSEKFSIIYPAFGVHPLKADTFNSSILKTIEEFSLNCKKVVAIGEIGLDFKLKFPDRKTQINTFIAQLELAKTLNLPVIIHCRRAFYKVYDLLKKYYNSSSGGVMHAYSGSYEMADKFITMGFYISVAGSVTYPNARRPLDNVKSISISNLIVETDSPYMLPFEYKDKEAFNKPYCITATLEKISKIKQINLNETANTLFSNSLKLFKRISLK